MVLIPVLLIALFASIAMAGEKHKGNLALGGVLAMTAASCIPTAAALTGTVVTRTFAFGSVFGDVTFRADGLTAWFVMLTGFTQITAILYGRKYLEQTRSSRSSLSLHYISYLMNQAAMLGVYFSNHGLAFLFAWEVMALSAFILVIFEHGKMETLKAGINYLIQSHVSIVFLSLGFLWVYTMTGSFDFTAISQYTAAQPAEAGLVLFLTFFAGFAIKAGFVPFHTWLPHAHPAAPSHVSGLMSGILIKSGIYGIIRMLTVVHVDLQTAGTIILILSVITGVYGVMLAIVQHNLKRLLAYHSIENIGIIGIGIGIGATGMALNRPLLASAGFGGALLHTLNHSLFKSLLFFTTGNVYQAIHTVMLEKTGGLIRKMPRTALLFLIAALAICGLPPFNGFISEFLIYSGLYQALGEGRVSTMFMVLSIVALALIGGLALLCFTKAFGTVFLGTERLPATEPVQEASPGKLLPGFIILIPIVAIGTFPAPFLRLLQVPVGEITGFSQPFVSTGILTVMQQISLAVWALLLLTGLLWWVRARVIRPVAPVSAPTWGCGYTAPTPKMQYTAGSFVQTYHRLIGPLVSTTRHERKVADILPGKASYASHTDDRVELTLIDRPVRAWKSLLGTFRFLQNGRIQFYVLYGIVFIAIAITIPLIIRAAETLFQLLNSY